MSSHEEYVKGLPLLEALWWFIENSESLPDEENTAIFFNLRERYRQGTRPAELDERELATITAALRLFQRTVFIPPEISAIATDEGEFVLMSDDEIDQLCEDLNQ